MPNSKSSPENTEFCCKPSLPAAGSAGLTFNALRAANAERIGSSKYRKCEENWTPAHWMQATVGELGELANLLKKVDRGDFPFDDVKADVAKELADVQTYLDILALKLGVDLGKATIDKFNEVSERIGSPVRLAALSAQQSDPWAPSGTDYDRAIHRNPDAKAWADFFVATFPGQADKHDLMIGWFANAMMAMHDYLKTQQSAPERVSVPVELLERITRRFSIRPHWDSMQQGAAIAELRALLASHAEGGKV